MKHTSVLKLTIILLLLGILTSCGMKVPTWQEQYDLGVRYLSEGNYEEAIIAFTAAIEIDPNYTDTYLKLAETYTGLGNYENAKSILEKGLESTGDDAIRNAINELFAEHLSLLLTTDVDYAKNYLVGGKSVVDCTLSDVIAAYPTAEEDEWYYDPIKESNLHEGRIQYSQRIRNGLGSTTDGVVADAVSIDSRLTWLSFQHEHSPTFDFRGIAQGDSFEDVIRKLGFTEEGVDFLKDNFSINVFVSSGQLRFSDQPLPNDTKDIAVYDDGFHLWFQFKNDTLRQFDYYEDT